MMLPCDVSHVVCFHFYHATLCCVCPKPEGIRVIDPNFGLTIFRHGKLIALTTTLVVIIEFVDDTFTTVDESWLFSTGRSTVTL